MQRFRGGLVFKAHRLLYHSTLGSRVIKKKRRRCTLRGSVNCGVFSQKGKSTRLSRTKSGSVRCPSLPCPQTRNPKPGTRNPKPETRNPKPEARNPKTENRKPKPETRYPIPDTPEALLVGSASFVPLFALDSGVWFGSGSRLDRAFLLLLLYYSQA